MPGAIFCVPDSSSLASRLVLLLGLLRHSCIDLAMWQGDSLPDRIAKNVTNLFYYTVKPVLSGHCTKRTPSIKQTRTPKKYLKWSFLMLPTCIKRTLVIKFHHPTCQTLEMRKIAIHKFFNFYIKKRDLTNLFDEFHSTVLFSISFCLYRGCFTHLISSILSCNPCLSYCEQLVHFDKEINATVYRHSLWKYSKRFHCSFEWYLTPHMTLSIETCIRRTPCIKQTLQHSPRVSA